ncbi:MAG: glycosyltransferase family 2 protein [Flavobacteriaceae bacterium]|nr:glycosyltransferase family 2 protein [Flavobacteriaceae bacterium]
MKPKVSLIIPIYNVEKYLEKCLYSAINQTLKEIEIIIVNDGSTDNSLAICQKYSKKDNRIKLFDQSNKGQGFARNLAIKNATGEFIFCLDADDWIELDTLEKVYTKSLQEKSEVVICGWKRIDEDSRDIVTTRKDIDLITNQDKIAFNHLAFSAKINLMACSCLIKKSIIDDNFITYPNIYHEDLYVMIKVYFFANKVSVIKEDLYNWLVRKNSTTNTFTMKHALGFGGIIFDWKNFLLKENAYNDYKNDYLIGIITYLNLYIVRARAYASENDKKQIFEYLDDLLKGTHELADYRNVLSPTEIKARGPILNYYDKTINSHMHFKKIENENKLLKKQLRKIKKSRGYKYLLKYYKFNNKLLPKNSKRRTALKTFMGLFLEKYKTYKYDVIFLPHKDYQVWTMGLIARELKKLGLSSCMMDLTDHYKDEGSRKEAEKFPDIPFKDLQLMKDNRLTYNALICMNDWDKKVVHPLIVKAKQNKKKTIGIIEGINDFYDADIKWERHAYQTVEYLFMTGEHDRQFFENKKNKAFVIGIPRLRELMLEEAKFPQKPLAVINVNFSYGVLEEQRDFWLDTVIEGCKKANIDYIITHHPADRADLSQYNVSAENMYDTIRNGSISISRFGSIILESIAMGKPSIYHNPHNEKVNKFQDPMGAYSLSFDSDSLADAIIYELSLDVDYRERANKFLDHHCNINSEKSSALLSAEKIQNILKGK